MKENRQIFDGSQVNMCEAARLGCTLYDGEQQVFEANNLMYSKEWSNDFRQKIIAALALPDEGTRRSIPSKKRDQLQVLAHSCTDIWLILSSCIQTIAAGNKEDSNSLLMEAGYTNYLEATQNKWPKVKALMEAGITFITNNQEWLLNSGKGMAPSFPERFNEVASAFTKTSDSFYDAKGDMPLETLSKVDAMNGVYTMLISMLSDGKKYFRRNRIKRELFSYKSLLSKVQGTSTVSGINIKLVVEGTLLPITTAQATFMPTGFSFDANEKGIIPCRVSPGKYNVTITAPGFVPFETAIIVKSGTIGRKKFIFTKAAESRKQETA